MGVKGLGKSLRRQLASLRKSSSLKPTHFSAHARVGRCKDVGWCTNVMISGVAKPSSIVLAMCNSPASSFFFLHCHRILQILRNDEFFLFASMQDASNLKSDYAA